MKSRLCAAFLLANSLTVTTSCGSWMKYETEAENKNGKGEPGAASITQSAANWADPLTDEVRIDCDAPGCLRSVTFLGSWTVDELKPYEESNQTLDNGYHLWQAYFATDDRYARVTVTIPDTEPEDEDGFSVVMNNPGTVGVASLCAPGYTGYGSGLAGTFGARGYIGAAVDYPGLGSEGVHPYLIRSSEGKASLDALRATRHLVSLLGIPLKDKDAVVGLSQGGHATLAAAELHATYAPELPIEGFGAVAPSNGYREQWTPYMQYAGSHLVFYALINYAWHQYYGEDDEASWAPGQRDAMVEMLTTHCLVGFEGDGLYDVMSAVPSELFSEALIDAFTFDDFSGFPALEQGFDASRIVSFESEASLRLFQGTDDMTVSQAASQLLVDDLKAGGTPIEIFLVGNATHTDTCFGPLGYTQLGNPLCFEWLHDILGP